MVINSCCFLRQTFQSDAFSPFHFALVFSFGYLKKHTYNITRVINMVVNVIVGNITLTLNPNESQTITLDDIKIEVGYKLRVTNTLNYDGIAVEKKLWFVVEAKSIEIDDEINEVGEFHVWNTSNPMAIEEFINNFEKEKVWRFEERLNIAIAMAKIARKYQQ